MGSELEFQTPSLQTTDYIFYLLVDCWVRLLGMCNGPTHPGWAMGGMHGMDSHLDRPTSPTGMESTIQEEQVDQVDVQATRLFRILHPELPQEWAIPTGHIKGGNEGSEEPHDRLLGSTGLCPVIGASITEDQDD